MDEMATIDMLLPDRELVAAVFWFMIGFGAGLAVLRLWKLVLAALVAAFIAPIILQALGLSLPITPEHVANTMVNGLTWFTGILATNTYSATGFIAGAAIALVIALLRRS